MPLARYGKGRSRSMHSTLFSPSLEWRVNTRLLRDELRKKMTPHSRIPVAVCEKKLGPCHELRKKMTPHSRIPVAFCEKKLGPCDMLLKKMTPHSRIPAAFFENEKGVVTTDRSVSKISADSQDSSRVSRPSDSHVVTCDRNMREGE